jgi:DHA1 family inner membrane transport protein
VPTSLRSLALAANASAMYLGMSLGAWTGAQLYARTGVETLMPASLVLTGLGLLALQRSVRAQRGEEMAICTGTLVTGTEPKVWVQ